MALLGTIFVVSRAAESSRPRLPAVGAQFHAFWSDYTDEEREQVLDRLAAAGVEWVRIDFSWAMLQPDDAGSYSAYAISLLDDVLGMTQRHHLEVLLTFWRTPAWANGGADELVAPREPEDYARAMAWLVEHYQEQVSAWEVWNEPNDPNYLRGADPRTYTALLRSAYRAVKAAAPEEPVVFGGLAFNDTDWLEEAYAAGAGGSFDVMATHPYQAVADLPPEASDDGTKWRLAHVTSVRDVMVRHGDEGKDIWFTEFGWSSHGGNGPEVPHEAWGVSREQQADYLARTLQLVSTRYAYVTHVFWYRERDASTGDAQLDNYGLLDTDLHPKPVLERLRRELEKGP